LPASSRWFQRIRRNTVQGAAELFSVLPELSNRLQRLGLEMRGQGVDGFLEIALHDRFQR
jgi:hypothetical protein